MRTMQAARARYVDDNVTTVSPARLVTMLYDALVNDLLLAERAIADRDLKLASDRLVHAQDVVSELHDGLRPSAWEGGAGLAQLYLFLHDQLVAANVHKDLARIGTCREMVEPLRQAWHEAAGTQATTSQPW